MNLWVVGQWKPGSASWDFVGVFSSDELAVAACADHTYFVGPTTLDMRTPDETVAWPGCRYPKDEAA